PRGQGCGRHPRAPRSRRRRARRNELVERPSPSRRGRRRAGPGVVRDGRGDRRPGRGARLRPRARPPGARHGLAVSPCRSGREGLKLAYDVALRWTYQRVPLRSRPARAFRRAGVRGRLRDREDPALTLATIHDFFHSSTWYVIRNLAIFFVLVF